MTPTRRRTDIPQRIDPREARMLLGAFATPPCRRPQRNALEAAANERRKEEK